VTDKASVMTGKSGGVISSLKAASIMDGPACSAGFQSFNKELHIGKTATTSSKEKKHVICV